MTKFTKILATVAMLWLVAVHATPLMAQQNYDFQVGQLYYKITDAAKREVAVVRENSMYPYYNNEPTGAVTIPAMVAYGGNNHSVTSIGYRAFSGCSGLNSVTVHWQTPLQVDRLVFDEVTLGNVKLIVPFGKKNVYKTALVWKDFSPIVEQAPINYIVTYNQSAGGTFTLKNGLQYVISGSSVIEGTVLTVEATPAQGYKLDSIRVNGTRISGLSFTVTDNTNIEVFFGKQSYTVTYNSNMYSGKIEVKRGSEIVASGSSVEYGTLLMVRAIPNHGFEVKSLTINDQAIVNNFVFSISESVEIKAVFAPTTTALDEAATKPLAIYPNPVADVLYLSATARTIRIYDMYGIEVAHATNTDRVEVSHLPAGIYTVRADGIVAKMVKR